ncbi:MAG: trypsin-like peptidase domain-containing protein, partial [Lachnospiraceae bacterium]
MESNQDETLFNNVTPSSADLPETPDEHSASDTYHFWAEENAASADTVSQESVQETFAAADEESFSSGAQPVYDAADEVIIDEVPKKQKREHRFLKKFFVCIASAACFGIVAGAAFFGIRHAYFHFFPEEEAAYGNVLSGTSVVTGKPTITIASTALSEVGEMDASETVSKVVEQTMPSMVSIKSLYTTKSYFFGQSYVEETEGGGSGIIVGSNKNDLLIATNYHVIENTSSLQAILADNTSHTVTVKGTDPAADLAILALPLSDLTEDTLSKIDIAVLGDSD